MDQTKETKPKWNNLKKNLCPRCGSVLEHNARSAICPGKDKLGSICGFSCSKQKFNLIVADKYFGFPRETYQVAEVNDMVEANLSALNNLDVHEDVYKKGLIGSMHFDNCTCDGCTQEEYERHTL